jgi:hypothetical protein
MRPTSFLCLAACALAAPALADVTLTQTSRGKASFVNVGGESVVRIKGNRMRIDETRGNDTTALILDLDKQQMVSIDMRKKEATVVTLASLQQTLAKFSEGDIKVKVTPTGESKQVAGHGCRVHDIAVTFPFSPGGDMSMSMALSGPACLSKDAPGYADYARLYKAAAERGFIFGDPRAAKGPAAAQAKGMASFYRAVAEAGVPLEQQISIGFEGSGPMAGMMNRMGRSNFTTTVTKIEEGALSDSLFEIPAGFKVKQQ